MLMITRLINYPVSKLKSKIDAPPVVKCSGGWCRNAARPGSKCCQACIDRAKRYYHNNKDSVKQKQKEYRDRLRDEDLCTRCKIRKVRKSQGKKMKRCLVCAKEESKRAKENRRKRRMQ